MPKRNLTEFLLARVIGSTRAEAVAGDLLELASSRGCLWYYAASFRTVLSFTWRFPAAFLIPSVIFLTLPNLMIRMLSIPLWHAWEKHPFIAMAIWQIVRYLSFVVVFAAIRYGAKDRLFKLAIAIFVAASLACFCLSMPRLLFVLAGLGVLAFACSLISAAWRGAFLVLVLTIAAGMLAALNFGNLAHLGCWLYEHKPLNATSHYRYFDVGYAFPHTIFWIVTWTISILEALCLFIVCSRLHLWLLPSSKEAKLA